MAAIDAGVHGAVESDTYHDFCKPKLAELLRALGLDQRYTRASGCTLWTDDERPVTDFIGGFGAAIAGHNHSVLVRALVGALTADTPVHAQASIRRESGRLAARLSELTPGRSEYYTCFTNSGTESVEAALKHAYKDLVSAAELGARRCIPMPVLAAATATYQLAMLEGHGALDKGAMVLPFEKRLDVQFRTVGE